MAFKKIYLKSLELRHFMNVTNGKILFQDKKQDDNGKGYLHVLGIYGQNGSGKTAFIHALFVLKKCFEGEKIGTEAADYIQNGFLSFKLLAVWHVIGKQGPMDIFYEVTVQASHDKNQAGAQICEENLSIRKVGERKKKILFSNDDNVLLPRKILKDILDGRTDKERTDFQIKRGIVRSQGRSFLFSDELFDVMELQVKETSNELLNKKLSLLGDLKFFAREFLYVIGIKDIGFINLDILMPVYFHMQKKNQHIFGSIGLPLNKSGSIPADMFHIAEKFINDSNHVLKYLIPGLQIQLKVLSTELNQSNIPMMNVELISLRGSQQIPLKYESAGIKKILSILHVFIGAYNNSSMLVAIDELDAGIFEYLLGEILAIFQEGGKGQLIFTSHNLRPLEILRKEAIVFTTTNPDHRYTHLKNIKANNNLRDSYYRTIVLGGQDEEMYQETNRYALEFALRKVGEYRET